MWKNDTPCVRRVEIFITLIQDSGGYQKEELPSKSYGQMDGRASQTKSSGQARRLKASHTFCSTTAMLILDEFAFKTLDNRVISYQAPLLPIDFDV